MSLSYHAGFRSCIAAVLAAFVLTVSVGAEPQQTDDSKPRPAGPPPRLGLKHTPAQKLILKGVGDFAEVSPTLYRGSQPTHEGFKNLAKLGIKIVVGVRGTKRDGEGKEVRALGMEYYAIPWHCPFPRDEVFARFLKLLRHNPGKKVFVHCRLGDDRNGMMIASYRMGIQGWSADEAMKEMEAFGFTPLHHFICPGLARYEKHFPEHLRNNAIFKELRAEDGKEAVR